QGRVGGGHGRGERGAGAGRRPRLHRHELPRFRRADAPAGRGAFLIIGTACPYPSPACGGGWRAQRAGWGSSDPACDPTRPPPAAPPPLLGGGGKGSSPPPPPPPPPPRP